MAEDNSSREAIERLAARLEHLESVLQANTARLHAVEERLRAAPPPSPERPAPRRPLYETIKDERDETPEAATGAGTPPPTT